MASKNFNGCEGERHKKAMVGQSQTVRSQLGKLSFIFILKNLICVLLKESTSKILETSLYH